MTPPPFSAIARAIERHNSFYITTHIGPDGDAVGPALALKIALEERGKRAVYVSRDGVQTLSRFLARSDEVLLSTPSADFRLRVCARLRRHAQARCIIL